MSIFQIPLSNVPQTFQISLAGKDYDCTCKYNSAFEGGWVIDLADAESGLPIVANLPLITGRNVLDGLDYLEFGGALYVYTDGDQTAVPTLDDLGIESNLYFQTEDV